MKQVAFWVTAISGLLGFGAQAQQTRHLPIEAFSELPAISNPQLSPDGTHIALIQQLDGKPAAVITSLNPKPGEKQVVVPSSDWTVSGLRWAKNDRVIVITRKTEKVLGTRFEAMWTRSVSVPTDGGPMVLMLAGRRSFHRINTTIPIADIDLSDPKAIFMPTIDIDRFERTYRTLLKADVATGAGETVFNVGSPNTISWVMDGQGNVVARLDLSPDRKTETIFAKDGDTWRQIWSRGSEYEEFERFLGLSEDGKYLILGVQDATGPIKLVKLKLQDGSLENLAENKAFDTDVVLDPWTRRVVGTSYTDDIPHSTFFAPAMQALQLGLERNFPGKSVTLISYDLAKDKVVAAVWSPTSPRTYYFVDRTSHQATKLGSEHPDLTEADLGQTKAYPYKASDGENIPAYLTLPLGKPSHNLPVVVMPHGGPELRDEITFDWWVQFLANRGYAVLQPNYRGSAGYGRHFTEAGFHQWGLKMQDDLTDGVQKLIGDGIADPRRVCIVGASYGGYAALAGATLTPNLYACAVSFAGVSDLRKLAMETREFSGARSGTAKYWEKRIGNPITDSEQLEKTSPVNLAANVKVPVLLMHGEGDSTVPIAQSEMMNDALIKAGKEVRFIRFPGEDHYMIEAATRTRILQETEAFLYKAIGH